MQRLSVIRWQQTQGKYVGILQDAQQFKADTLKPRSVGNLATVLVGELVGTYRTEWYCITFPKEELEFEEARDRAKKILDQENALRAAGRPSLAGG